MTVIVPRVSHAKRLLYVNRIVCVNLTVRLNHADRLVHVNRIARLSHLMLLVVLTDHVQKLRLMRPSGCSNVRAASHLAYVHR